MSGVGDEIGELDKLLMRVKEARDDLHAKKSAKRSVAKALVGKKDNVGQELL